MTSRKTRRNVKREPEMSSSAMKKLIFMFVAIGLMVFSVTQVYFLTKYTLGHDVPADKLKIYRWVQLLVSGDSETQVETNLE